MSYFADRRGKENVLNREQSKDAIVIRADGICVESSNPDFIGLKFKVTEKSAGSPPGENVTTTEDEEKSYSIIENFAKLLMDKYKNERHADNTDLIITKIINTDSPLEMKSLRLEAETLGSKLDVRRACVLLHLKDFAREIGNDNQSDSEKDEIIKKWKNRINNCVNGFFTKNNDIIVAYVGGENFVVFKAIDDENKVNFYKLMRSSYKSIFSPLKFGKISCITAGFSNPYEDVDGLKESYEEAKMALEVGAKLRGQEKCYYFGDMDILHILADGNQNKKLMFANKILQKLDGHDESLQTLEAFFNQNLNLTDTSKVLKIHRNTVIYRLGQIAETLNMDPFDFDDACKIKVSMMVKKIVE